MFEYFDNWVMSYQLNRLLAEIPDGGGTFGEAHRAASAMTDGDFESWYREWNRLGDAVASAAEENDHPATRRDALLRASNYYRSANFFLDQSTAQAASTYENLRSSFRGALDTGTMGGERVEVAAEDGTLTGYYFETDQERSTSATLLLHGGADSVQEECYFFGVPRALERGFDCLIFDGYGQGDAIRDRGMYSRPDWEVSVSPFVDWVESERPTDRIGLFGASLGGYYGARAAAVEDRLDAVALWSACFDVLHDIYDHYPSIQGTLQWLVDADSDAQARDRLSAFTLEDAPKITTDLLITHGTEDTIIDPAAVEKTAAMASSVETRLWEGEEHCTVHEWVGATSFMFDWLADRLIG